MRVSYITSSGSTGRSPKPSLWPGPGQSARANLGTWAQSRLVLPERTDAKLSEAHHREAQLKDTVGTALLKATDGHSTVSRQRTGRTQSCLALPDWADAELFSRPTSNSTARRQGGHGLTLTADTALSHAREQGGHKAVSCCRSGQIQSCLTPPEKVQPENRADTKLSNAARQETGQSQS